MLRAQLILDISAGIVVKGTTTVTIELLAVFIDSYIDTAIHDSDAVIGRV